MKIRNRNGLTHTAFNACDKQLCDWANFLSLISATRINSLDKYCLAVSNPHVTPRN